MVYQNEILLTIQTKEIYEGVSFRRSQASYSNLAYPYQISKAGGNYTILPLPAYSYTAELLLGSVMALTCIV